MRDLLLLTSTFHDIVRDMGLPWPDKAIIAPPRDPRHGDLATNLALVLTRQAGMTPRALAERLAAALGDRLGSLVSTDIAGPGFLNVTLAPAFWQRVVMDVENQGDRFGSSSTGHGRTVLLEYVSANPTGPLHIGHGRGAAVGDSLARVLRFAGYDVTTEYYINDAGRQMRLLGLSVYLRLREAVHLPVSWPEDYYHGDYIRDIALELLEARPELSGLPEREAMDICFHYAMNSILEGIKADLARFHVEHQVWFSERSLVDAGTVEATLDDLRRRGLAYDQDGALWFASSGCGDDKDRVLRKSDGSLTYFASDIAYHANKYARGFAEALDVWGADHHGYVPRMKAAVTALGRNADTDFGVVLIQLVNLLRAGEQVAMSTRSGEFVTLAEVLDEVGTDAARFMFLSRKSDSPLDFDLDLVKQRNMDNPVYYVQYAHARIAALLRRAEDRDLKLPLRSDESLLAPLTGEADLALLRATERFVDAVTDAAETRAPHGISFYLMDLAGRLHSYYAATPVLGGDSALTLARLAMLRAVGRTLANGLALLGVSAPDSM
ncbi:MAG: arginine--tRNA ligase [Desulfovibrionaceae bacterium]|nr:arginine--tRNA ligase [Desulfovibrionaceae bacterium]